MLEQNASIDTSLQAVALRGWLKWASIPSLNTVRAVWAWEQGPCPGSLGKPGTSLAIENATHC